MNAKILNIIPKIYPLNILLYIVINIFLVFSSDNVPYILLPYLDLSFILMTAAIYIREYFYYRELKITARGSGSQLDDVIFVFSFFTYIKYLFLYFFISLYNPNPIISWKIDHTTVIGVINGLDVTIGLFGVFFAIVWILVIQEGSKELIKRSNEIEEHIKPLFSMKMLPYPPVIDENNRLPESAGELLKRNPLLWIPYFILYTIMLGGAFYIMFTIG